MKLSSKSIVRIIVALFVFLYCFILFMVKHDVNYPTFWVNFVFVMLPFVAIFIATFLKATSLNRSYLVAPQIKIAFSYLVLELILGTILMNIKKLQLNVTFLIQIPILVIAIIGILYFTIGTKNIDNKLKYKKEKKNYIIILRTTVYSIYDTCTDNDVKKELVNLINLIKYSETNSPSGVLSIEQKIDDLVGRLEISKEKEEQLQLIKEIEIQLNKRNRLTIGLK